jgi:hypothetical protein
LISKKKLMTVCLEFFKKMLGEKIQFGLSP